MATAGVQVSFSPPETTAAVTSVGPGGPACSGPFGHPPKPGPPSSPSSAMVIPCRLPSASVTCQDSSRSPPPVAAISATAASSNSYVAVKVFPVTERPELYPPLGAGVSGPGTARTSRRATAVPVRAGLTIRCSRFAGSMPSPTWPTTVRVVEPVV